jgi:hypothetical protein
MRGRAAVLRVVERALDVVLVGTDVDGAAMLRSGLGSRQRPEARQLGQGHVDLQRGAGIADPLDVVDECLWQLGPVEKLQKGHVGIGVARHDGSEELVAACQRHADGSALAHEDACHLGVATDVGAEVAGDRRQGLRQPAHTAAHVSPHAPLAAALAHHVVEEHVGRARHRGTCHRADDRVRRQCPLQLLGLEPAIEDRARGTAEDLDGLAGAVAQLPE